MDYIKYATAMNGAANPSDGDEKKMAGGVASVTYNKDSGKRELENFHCLVGSRN